MTKITKTPTTKKANLDKKNIKVAEAKIKEQENIYTFDYDGLDTDALKNKRQNSRNRLKGFISSIINYSDLQKNPTELSKKIKEFKAFYKETYILNNYEVSSVRSKVNEKEKKDIERMMEIVKASTKKSLNTPKKESNKEAIQA